MLNGFQSKQFSGAIGIAFLPLLLHSLESFRQPNSIAYLLETDQLWLPANLFLIYVLTQWDRDVDA